MITLKLTPSEARTLQSILYNVAGSPTESARKFADSVYNKLSAYRRDYLWANTGFNQQPRGSISFESGPQL